MSWLGCCCDTVPSAYYYRQPCIACNDLVPDCWEVTIAGITNNNCTGCNYYNRTWYLDWSPGAFGQCIWETPEDPWDCVRDEPWPASFQALELEATYNSSTNKVQFVLNMYIIGFGGTPAHWFWSNSSDITQDSCYGEHLLPDSVDADSWADNCSNTPTSVTITPSSC